MFFDIKSFKMILFSIFYHSNLNCSIPTQCCSMSHTKKKPLAEINGRSRRPCILTVFPLLLLLCSTVDRYRWRLFLNKESLSEISRYSYPTLIFPFVIYSFSTNNVSICLQMKQMDIKIQICVWKVVPHRSVWQWQFHLQWYFHASLIIHSQFMTQNRFYHSNSMTHSINI